MIQTNAQRKCSFCGKSNPVMGGSANGVTICKKCVSSMHEWMFEDEDKSNDIFDKVQKECFIPLKPSQIKAHLDEYVIGQDEAKIALSVAVYNHYKRTFTDDKDIEIQKSNILMIGPTGSGKTYLVQTLAKILDVPFAIADATSLTQAGYAGEDVENIISRLLSNANGNIERAEKGIVYIDEIDKLSMVSSGPSFERDVSGTGVQQALLKLLEGSEIEVPVKSMGDGKNYAFSNANQTVTVNTANILFICGGAFEGLKESAQDTGARPIGFGKIEEKKEIKPIENHDLVKYGLMPEFIGRLPVVTILNSIDKESLLRILTEPKNAIVKQYQKLLLMDGVQLDFDKSALEYIAEKAMQKGSGARGLRSIIESCMTRIMYEVPDMEDVERIQVIDSTIETGVPIVVHTQHPKKIRAKR